MSDKAKAQKQSILSEVLAEYATGRESIPEQVKAELKREASYDLAARLPEQIAAEPETIAELVEAWLIILSHKGREKGIRTQLSFSRTKKEE